MSAINASAVWSQPLASSEATAATTAGTSWMFLSQEVEAVATASSSSTIRVANAGGVQTGHAWRRVAATTPAEPGPPTKSSVATSTATVLMGSSALSGGLEFRLSLVIRSVLSPPEPALLGDPPDVDAGSVETHGALTGSSALSIGPLITVSSPFSLELGGELGASI
eukprot:1193909-Prorocentrum_minimum.AAC.1